MEQASATTYESVEFSPLQTFDGKTVEMSIMIGYALGLGRPLGTSDFWHNDSAARVNRVRDFLEFQIKSYVNNSVYFEIQNDRERMLSELDSLLSAGLNMIGLEVINLNVQNFGLKGQK